LILTLPETLGQRMTITYLVIGHQRGEGYK